MMPTPTLISLADHWRRHEGATVSVLGNGPTISDVTSDRLEGTVVLGVHSLAWHPLLRHHLDYWLCIDTEPAQVACGTRPMPSGAFWAGGPPKCRAIVREGVSFPPRGRAWVPEEMTMVTGMQGPVVPEVCTEEVAGRGVLAMGLSSIVPALHLSCLWGASTIRLFGVDCGGDRRSWDDPSPLPAAKSAALRAHREQLEAFEQAWVDRVQVVNLSPVWWAGSTGG